MYMSEPITETYVMELSQSLADRVNANGDYVCHLAEPVTLRDGDELVMRMASIDSQKTTDTTVVIPEDLPLSMQFSYYDTNTFNDTYKITPVLFFFVTQNLVLETGFSVDGFKSIRKCLIDQFDRLFLTFNQTYIY